MTPYTQTTSDVHVTVYQTEVRAALQRSRAPSGARHTLRRHIARGLVRTGAWLLPDKPEVIGGTVLVLPTSPAGHADRTAA